MQELQASKQSVQVQSSMQLSMVQADAHAAMAGVAASKVALAKTERVESKKQPEIDMQEYYKKFIVSYNRLIIPKYSL
jgi:hypothetical protein